jgi:hypothetical protein
VPFDTVNFGGSKNLALLGEDDPGEISTVGPDVVGDVDVFADDYWFWLLD